ncbi:MAG: hypothetical protein LBT05_14265, partial [Planctomycetaceae bacterium]|nr:hypothetical protein [Planctomycetaceae bacterium]
HPNQPYSWYRHILEMIHKNYPSLQLKAWTAVEIAAFAEESEKRKPDVAARLADVRFCKNSSNFCKIYRIFIETHVTYLLRVSFSPVRSMRLCTPPSRFSL